MLTGGQDDLVSIWSVAEQIIVARCQGHQSWVSAVAFDPWRCDDRNYRFGSVGEDCRLLLWDFNVGMLHRPKAVSVKTYFGPAKPQANQYSQSSVRHRGSISSRLTNTLLRAETQNTTSSRLRPNSMISNETEDEPTIKHPVEPKARTAVLPPVLVRIPPCDLQG